jgi:hypothetical protein
MEQRTSEVVVKGFLAFTIAVFILVALAGWWFFYQRREPETQVSGPSPSPVPRGAAIRTPEDALKALVASDDVTCIDPFPLPPEEGPKGRASLVCGRTRVAGSGHPWQMTVWVYKDPFFAERAYREDCFAFQRDANVGLPVQAWIIYERGHLWLAELRDDDFDDIRVPPGEPSRELGETVANVLGAQAWQDCGAVS